MAEMNQVASANRVHIGFFGCRNAGKSSLVNAITDQELAVVSDVAGTTTDPVTKSMELLPLGPVVIIDTPGFDDEGQLGDKRVKKTRQILNRADIAVLVIDGSRGMAEDDRLLVSIFKEKEIPYMIVLNKNDKDADAAGLGDKQDFGDVPVVSVSARTRSGIKELKETLARLVPEEDENHTFLGNLVNPGETVVLVCPIDSAAPKGRLIMPQQMAVRDLLDRGSIAVVVKESELEITLANLKKPGTGESLVSMVITDSQAFKAVSAAVPDEIPLTSFSIVMAKYKGFLETAIKGVAAIKNLKDGDKVLMAEGCTHHRQCGDIGTVKIPALLKKYTGKDLVIETCSGREFPEELTDYSIIIHCGGCMITERDVQYRMKCAMDQGVPFTNYGTAIALMTGILERSLRSFPEHTLL